MTLKQKFEDNYTLKNHTINNLKSLGFRKYHAMCDEDTTYYIYKFPVCKYLGTTTLECELKVDSNNGNIRLDVYDMDNDIFSIFYNEYSKSYEDFITKIKNKINREFKKLGIEKINKKE